jgi:hypothetical protein
MRWRAVDNVKICWLIVRAAPSLSRLRLDNSRFFRFINALMLEQLVVKNALSTGEENAME